jgi:hypothetical protein
MKGAGLWVAQIKDFLNASYAEIPANNIREYQLGIDLSNKFGKV